MNIRQTLSRLVAALLVVGALASPAQAGTLEPSQTPWGDVSIGAEGQLVPGRPLLTSFSMLASFMPMDVNLALRFPPSDFTSLFLAEADVAFVGQTGGFFPLGLNLMPLMGFGGGMYLGDFPDGAGGTTSDANAYLYAPIGLKYAIPLGPLSVGARVIYYHRLFEVMSNRTGADPSRMHYELAARLGPLGGAVFYEAGTLLSGPGARVALTF
jgi:hypothetical protein